MFGWDDAIGLGLGVFGAVQGRKDQKKANQLQERAMAEQQRQYDQRAPLRNLGMQALGRNEGAIDMGNIGFDSNNPFARARGPTPSTATLGGWDKMTFDAPMEQTSAERDAEQRRGLLGTVGKLPTGGMFGNLGAKARRSLAELGQQPLPSQTRYGWQK